MLFRFALAVACLLVHTAPGAEPAPRIRLFNGENLHGWHAHNCEAKVEDGLLIAAGGNGVLRSDLRYDDFIFELECRNRQAQNYDSGIYLRCELPPDGKPFPAKYQINLKQGDECSLVGFPQTRQPGKFKAGEWNKFRVTVRGEHATLEVNGEPIWETDGLTEREGFLGIQVEVPAGGQFEFREIYVTELPFRSLFDGASLQGWEGAGQEAEMCWQVADGLLVCTGEKGPWLRSQEQFGDFDLRLEYRLKEGGNSGVYVRVPEDGTHHGDGSGVEIQILDDGAERYRTLKPYQYTGSVYAIAPATQHVGYPPGTWNSLEISCRGPDYKMTHNGVVILEAKSSEFPDLAKRRLEGFLGLQNHSEQVWFRNIRIRTP